MSTKDTDLGRERILRELALLSEFKAEVGAHDPENAQKLAWAEFGTSTAPARPVVRQTLENEGNDLAAIIKDASQDVLSGSTAHKALDKAGARIARELKDAIDNFDKPANADSTAAAKGGNDPLVNTRAMLESITHKVTK